jgi:ketosteroid isomerase-like protein
MRWCTLILLGGVFGCAGGETPATVDDLMEADRTFARETAARGADGWVEAFAPDGMMFRNARPLVGHDAIRQAMQPAFESERFTLTWEPLGGEISSAGDLGYTWGEWESRTTGEGDAVTVSSGTYVTIWRRSPAGGWRVALDIGNDEEEEPGADTGS